MGKVQTTVEQEHFMDIKLLKTKYYGQTFIRKHYLNRTIALCRYMRLIRNDTDVNNKYHTQNKVKM